MAVKCPPGTKLVPAHCRSTQCKSRRSHSTDVDREAQAELVKLRKYVQRIQKTFGYFDEKQTYTAKDVALKAVIDKVQETPLFIAFAVNMWQQKDICHQFPGANSRYAFIAKQWKQLHNGSSFEKAAAAKYAVMSIVLEPHLRSRR